jgi:hypothetical protein
MTAFKTFKIVANPTAALKCDYCQQTLTKETRNDIKALERDIPAADGIRDGKPAGSPAVMCSFCCYMERC